MDTRNYQNVKYITANNWSKSIRTQIIISNNNDKKISNWNILPLSDKFEYSKQLFNTNN